MHGNGVATRTEGPVPRRRWRMERRPQLTPDVERYFASGWDLSADMLRVLPDQHEPLWRAYAAEFLAAWIAKYPGWRPAAWWTFDAPEPRLVLEGAEFLLPKETPIAWQWVWRGNHCGGFGVPAFRQVRPPGDVELPVVESTAAYLRRLELLTPSEHAALDLEDFEPETIDPFVIDADTRESPGGLYDPDAWVWWRAQQPRWRQEWTEHLRGEPTTQ
jgi:hypothetical protein